MKLSMLMLGVENLGKSVEFYRDVVGLATNGQVEQFAFLDAGEVKPLVLSQPLGAPRSHSALGLWRRSSPRLVCGRAARNCTREGRTSVPGATRGFCGIVGCYLSGSGRAHVDFVWPRVVHLASRLRHNEGGGIIMSNTLLSAGVQAPDFTLHSAPDKTVSLSELEVGSPRFWRFTPPIGRRFVGIRWLCTTKFWRSFRSMTPP